MIDHHDDYAKRNETRMADGAGDCNNATLCYCFLLMLIVWVEVGCARWPLAWVRGHNKAGLAGWRDSNKVQGVRQSNKVLTQKVERMVERIKVFFVSFERMESWTQAEGWESRR